MTTFNQTLTFASGQDSFLAQADAKTEPQAACKHESMLRRYLSPAPQFELVGSKHPERAEAERFIAERYSVAYHADVSHFLPWLLTLRCLGGVSGVAGMCPADSSPLFLEHYLDQPLEALLAEHSGEPVARTSIVEIGNLAAAQRGASHILFLLFTSLLQRAGYEWITFTATKALRNNLEKLGFPLITLTEADIGRLDADERATWGSYYDTAPLVMAGRLSTAMDIIQSRPLLRRVLRMYRYRINVLAEELRGR